MTPTATQEVPRPGAASGAKRAAKVADQIIEDVMALGWPVGEVLGSESELLERYHVSRAVFREAVRLIEHLEVARTRRGPGGGLVVTEPTVGAVIDAVVLYLQRVDAPLDEIFKARILLEEIACDLAAARSEEEDLTALRRLAANEEISAADARDLHTLVASISRNEGVALFVEVFNQVALLYSPQWQSIGATVEKESLHAHAMIAEAIMEGNGGLAANRMRKHLEAEADFFRRRRSTRQLLPESVMLAATPHEKGAEAVARTISRSIMSEGLAPGDLVGSERELIERMGVSRAILREAVRIMEHHHVARMRRGQGGGLYVMAPSVSAVTETVATYLARRGMQLSELAELRTGVEVAIADLAAARIDEEGARKIEEALVREANATDAERIEAVHDLHAAVAAAAHNRALELMALVLIRLSRLHQIERLAPRARKQIRNEVLHTHEGIAAAIVAGNRELARHRMRRHLQALGTFLR